MKPVLETQPHRELKIARRGVSGARNRAECRGAEGRIRLAVLRRVRDVESLGAELQAHLLHQLKVLHERHVSGFELPMPQTSHPAWSGAHRKWRRSSDGRSV